MPHARIKILPFFIRSDDVRVATKMVSSLLGDCNTLSAFVIPIRGRPIKHIWELDMLSVIRAFQEVQHIELTWMFRNSGRNVVVFVQNQICVFGSISIWSYLACVHRTFSVCKKGSTCNGKTEESYEAHYLSSTVAQLYLASHSTARARCKAISFSVCLHFLSLRSSEAQT